jgi:hypothetical protein
VEKPKVVEIEQNIDACFDACPEPTDNKPLMLNEIATEGRSWRMPGTCLAECQQLRQLWKTDHGRGKG